MVAGSLGRAERAASVVSVEEESKQSCSRCEVCLARFFLWFVALFFFYFLVVVWVVLLDRVQFYNNGFKQTIHCVLHFKTSVVLGVN